MRDFIFVTGIHRGGTTIIGKILAAARSTKYIHEPCNFNYGLKIINKWYSQKSNDHIIHEITKLSLNFKRGKQTKSYFYKKLSFIIPSKAYLGFLLLKIPGIYNNVIIKDPFLSLSVDSIVRMNKKCVFVFRDPYLFANSIERKQWNNLPLEDLFEENKNYSDELLILKNTFNNSNDNIERSFIFWGILHKQVLDKIQMMNKRQRSNIYVLNYIEVCLSPNQIFFNLFKFLNIDINDKILKIINDSFFAASDVDLGKRTHVLQRDAIRIVEKREILKNDPRYLKSFSLIRNIYKDFLDEID